MWVKRMQRRVGEVTWMEERKRLEREGRRTVMRFASWLIMSCAIGAIIGYLTL